MTAPEPIYWATNTYSFLVGINGRALATPNKIETRVNNYLTACGSLINYCQEYPSLGVCSGVPFESWLAWHPSSMASNPDSHPPNSVAHARNPWKHCFEKATKCTPQSLLMNLRPAREAICYGGKRTRKKPRWTKCWERSHLTPLDLGYMICEMGLRISHEETVNTKRKNKRHGKEMKRSINWTILAKWMPAVRGGKTHNKYSFLYRME